MKKLLVATVIGTVFAASSAFAYSTLKTTEGTIEYVGPRGKSLTLVDGTVLRIPSNISPAPLAPGEEVTVSYRDGNDGQKVMTAFWVDSGPGGDSSHQ